MHNFRIHSIYTSIYMCTVSVRTIVRLHVVGMLGPQDHVQDRAQHLVHVGCAALPTRSIPRT
jgi:hypothetical protein